MMLVPLDCAGWIGLGWDGMDLIAVVCMMLPAAEVARAEPVFMLAAWGVKVGGGGR